MAEIFVIRLADGAQVSWLPIDTTGARSGSVEHGPLSVAAEKVGDRKVVILAPANRVLLTSVNLPIRNAAKLRQALPFALEEQVAEDLDRLHFSSGRRTGSGAVPVAIVRREDLEGWLAQLSEVGIEPAALYAEHGSMPKSPTASVWMLEHDTCLARQPGEPPITIEGDSVDDFLVFADPRQDQGESERASHLTVYLGADERRQYEADLESLRESLVSLDLKLLPDGTLPHLAAGAVSDPGVNLLQGPYAPSTGMEKLWRPWRAAAALLLALVVITIGRQAIELSRLKSVDAELDAAIEQVFKGAMPDVQRIVNPRRQMETRLAAIRAARGGSEAPFLQSLEALSQAIGAAPGSRVDSLSFRAGIMEVKLTAPSVDSLDSIQRSVEASGSLDAAILSANPRGDAVEGRIQLTVPGA